jgi:hypothetical protein
MFIIFSSRWTRQASPTSNKHRTTQSSHFFGMDFYGHRVTVSRWDRSSVTAHEIHDSFHLMESQIVDIRHRVGSDKKYRWALFGCVHYFLQERG